MSAVSSADVTAWVIAQETGTRVYADLFLGIQSPADQESEFGA